VGEIEELCAHCGKIATGYARINEDRLCHGDDDPEPTCYMRASWKEIDKLEWKAKIKSISFGKVK
jgi:hypothetical protein